MSLISTLALLFLYIIMLTVCGNSLAKEAETEEIAGGTLAKLRQFPYAVFVHTKFGGNDGACTGSILTDTWVLTVAHCIQEALEKYKDNYEINVVAGTTDWSYRGEFAQDRRIGEEIHQDPKRYIALMRLERPFVFNAYVGAIGLASSIPENEAMNAWRVECTMVGYGATIPEEFVTNRRMFYLKGYIVPCIGSYYERDDYVCVDTVNDGETTCGGDSGGPLVCEGHLVGALKGKTGFDMSVSLACGQDKGVVQVYFSMVYYYAWIRSHVYVARTVDKTGGSSIVKVSSIKMFVLPIIIVLYR